MDPSHGGPSQGIRNSIPALSQLGIENEVLSFDNPKSDFLKHERFPIYAIGEGKTPYAYNRELANWLETHLDSYDVVIVHGLWLYNSYGTYKAWRKHKSRGGKTKLFIMPHGMLDPYFQRAKGRRLKAIRNWIFWKLFESKVINDADGLLFTCEQELLLARDAFSPYHPKKELNIGYGIAAPPVNAGGIRQTFLERCPTVKTKRFLLFLSRIHPKKGVDLLISAYLDLKGKTMDLPDLVIAGPGLNTTFGEQLQEMTKDDSQIHFPGMLQGDAKWGAFYNCDAFILPSHQENFGIAVVEAMACGKAVLISDQVNIWREIAEGKGGLVEPDELEGIKNLLIKWSQCSDAEQKEMGQKAKLVYERCFTVEQAALKMKAALEGAVSSK